MSVYTDLILGVSCPSCDARPGVRCVAPASGNTKATPHSQRILSANAARIQNVSWISDDTKTSFLPLSVRAANCLLNMNLHTVRQVREVRDDKLLRFPNMGHKSLKEIRDLVGYAPGNGPVSTPKKRRWALYANEQPERQIYGPFDSQEIAERWARATLDPAGIRWFGAPIRRVQPVAAAADFG